MLNHKLEIYVPSTVNIDTPVDNTQQVEKVLKHLASRFGGASAQQIRGCWIADNGNPVFENTVICFAYCEADKLELGKTVLRFLAEYLKTTMQQEAVAVVIDGSMEFI